MTVMKRRSRMVSFRLSEEEYEGLKHICVTAGARSLSDIARDAVHRLLGGGFSKNNLEVEMQTLNSRMDALDSEVRRLARLLDGPAVHGPKSLDTASRS